VLLEYNFIIRFYKFNGIKILILITVLIHLLSFKKIDYSSNPIPIFATLQPDVLDDFQLAKIRI